MVLLRYVVKRLLMLLGGLALILSVLADEAVQQWTGRFNPRPVSETELLHLYSAAL